MEEGCVGGRRIYVPIAGGSKVHLCWGVEEYVEGGRRIGRGEEICSVYEERRM